MRNKKFIPIERINKEIVLKQFKYKRSVKDWVGLGLIGFGLITIPFPTGSPLFIGVGLLLSSPLGLRVGLRNSLKELKFRINKRFVLWGLRLINNF